MFKFWMQSRQKVDMSQIRFLIPWQYGNEVITHGLTCGSFLVLWSNN